MKDLLFIAMSLFFFNFSLIAQSRISECNYQLINAIMEDAFSPPVASRIHLYTNIAAYQVLYRGDNNYNTLSSQISHLPPIGSDDISNVDLDMAAEVAFLNAGFNYIFTEDKLRLFYNDRLNYWKKRLNPSNFNKSLEYGKTVASDIIKWSSNDNYKETRTMHRYVVSDSLGAWVPTPPEYENAIEPNWQFMRKMTLKENEFINARPTIAYSVDTNSQFYKNAIQVYQVSKTLTPSQIDLANYWDDNPMTHQNKGHFSYIFKKPTPGGHWIKITSQVINKLNLTELQAAELYAMVSIAMYDAFINAWHTKYTNNTIRPITYLHRIGYTDFEPIIETPYFPEYTSAHSCVSRAITTILTHYISDNYKFIDTAQLMLGLSARSFNSFYQASDEASISRLCGGIHFLPALIYGQEQGSKIGNHIINTIKTQKRFKSLLNPQ